MPHGQMTAVDSSSESSKPSRMSDSQVTPPPEPPFHSATSNPSACPRRPCVLTSGSLHHKPPVKLPLISTEPPLPPLSDSFQPPPPSPAAPVEPFIIGVTGASASGKTTVCKKIIDGLGDQRCVLISVDWFYYGMPPGADASNYNFDHPSAFDFPALAETLEQMRMRKPVSVQTYNFALHKRDETKTADLDIADVIIVEGILTFYDPTIRDMMHMKVFVDEDADICLSRRIRRDVESRGRSVESILTQYARFVKPAYEEFILPTKRYADMIMPRGGDNVVLIDMIIKHIALKIRQDDLRKLYPGLVVMADSFQMRGLHTIIRDRHATRDDIVFYSNRLMRLLVEEGLGLLPFRRKPVITSSGGTYYGVGFVAGLAAISLLPAGVTMESSLRAVCNTVRIGKMMIRSANRHSERGGAGAGLASGGNGGLGIGGGGGDSVVGGVGRGNDVGGDARSDEVTYENLPEGLSERHILVLAPVLNSGRACEKAVERLIEVGCHEDRIIVLSLVVAPQAVIRICSQFPNVKLVVSAVDKGLDEDGHVYPGIGDFATRYCGTE